MLCVQSFLESSPFLHPFPFFPLISSQLSSVAYVCLLHTPSLLSFLYPSLRPTGQYSHWGYLGREPRSLSFSSSLSLFHFISLPFPDSNRIKDPLVRKWMPDWDQGVQNILFHLKEVNKVYYVSVTREGQSMEEKRKEKENRTLFLSTLSKLKRIISEQKLRRNTLFTLHYLCDWMSLLLANLPCVPLQHSTNVMV